MNEDQTNNPSEQEDADDTFETVWEGYDAALGQMFEELLRQEGFTARLIGTRTAALIGVGQFTIPLRVEVPAAAAEEARAVLLEFRNTDFETDSEESTDSDTTGEPTD